MAQHRRKYRTAALGSGAQQPSDPSSANLRSYNVVLETLKTCGPVSKEAIVRFAAPLSWRQLPLIGSGPANRDFHLCLGLMAPYPGERRLCLSC